MGENEFLRCRRVDLRALTERLEISQHRCAPSQKMAIGVVILAWLFWVDWNEMPFAA
jgi:hypothetical protein